MSNHDVDDRLRIELQRYKVFDDTASLNTATVLAEVRGMFPRAHLSIHKEAGNNALEILCGQKEPGGLRCVIHIRRVSNSAVGCVCVPITGLGTYSEKQCNTVNDLRGHLAEMRAILLLMASMIVSHCGHDERVED